MSQPTYLARFEEMKRYVRFSDRDEEMLRLLRGVAEPHFADIATDFYERTREHEDAHAVFRDDGQIEGLQGSMVSWLGRILSGPYDAAYCEKTARIGQRHHQLGLPQRFMFTGMTLLRLRLQAIAEQELPEQASEIARALARVLDVELGLMCGTYLDAHAERIHRFEQDAKTNMYQTLEKNERRYVRAVELAQAIIVGLDREGMVHLFNPEAERVSGYAADQARGMHFAGDLLAGEDDCPFEAAFAEVMHGANGTSKVHATCSLRTRNGRLRDVALHLVRAPDDDDEVVVYVHGEDVTGRMEMEARLRQSERLAVVGTLAAGLAHEIRNPLNGAQLHLTFLRRGLARLEAEDSQEWVDAVGVVAGEITRLSDLVSDFLDFARPRQLKPETVSLSRLCARSIDIVRADAAAHDAELELKLPRNELDAYVDAAMLEQVLLNLLRNAVDAVADTGGGRVELRLKRTPGHAVVEVVDDGPGLSDPNGPIFDAFYTTKSTGTGLGLAIVHRIIADHGGIIAVTSRPGETVFRVRLPLASQPVVNSELPPPSVTVHKAGTS